MELCFCITMYSSKQLPKSVTQNTTSSVTSLEVVFFWGVVALL